MNDLLTKNFALSEFTRSETATRLGLDNTPPQDAVSNLQCLCQEVLEPLREYAQRPIVITSGYRCRRLNEALGGATHSQHCLGEAADIWLPDAETGHDWFMFIADYLHFDQLIWEFSGPTAWIHVSYRRRFDDNRRQMLARECRRKADLPSSPLSTL